MPVSGNPEPTYSELPHLNLVGRSPAFQECFKLIKRLARFPVPVLIEGETGTGKELFARALHYLSPKSNQPFIPINCGAVPETLIESELFGHEKGAFTDAKTSQQGVVAQAGAGSLLLDEIDSLPPKGQTALLRFLQDHQFKPLGSSKVVQSHLRIIAATNAQLDHCVNNKTFREDLWFRLNVVKLSIPSLRNRIDDIPLLTQHFIQKFAVVYNLPPKEPSSTLLEWLLTYTWPGNIRELENVLHRAFLLSDGDTLELETVLPSSSKTSEQGETTSLRAENNFKQSRIQAIQNFEKTFLQKLMKETRGNISAAARKSGKERRALGRLLQKYIGSIEPAIWRSK